MIDITTTYMGLPLRSPIVASASPLCDSLENIRRFEENGVGAVVLPSLFEEQLELESNAINSDLSRGAESFPESLNYFPNLQNYNLGPDSYLELIRKARLCVSIPVIASLNGTSVGGWTYHAKLIEQAGASALELNIYDVVSDPHHSGSKNRRGLLRARKASQGECSYSCGREDLSIFYGDGQHGQAAG
jgi:dihydroorotate dehydrogenase (fumarate)